MKELNIIAKNKVQIEGWEAYRFECIVGGWIVTGSSAVLKKAGKNKGRFSYLTQNKKQVIVTDNEVDEMKTTMLNAEIMGRGKAPII